MHMHWFFVVQFIHKINKDNIIIIIIIIIIINTIVRLDI